MCLDKTILIVVILYLINFRCLIILCMHAHSFIILDHEFSINKFYFFFNLQFSSIKKRPSKKSGQNYGRIRPGLMGRNYVDHLAG